MDLVTYASTLVLAYLLGAIPTGFLLGKARGLDLRTLGSGNIGATNVFRVLGPAAGTFVLAFDAIKGYLPCLLAARIGVQFLQTPGDPQARAQLSIIAGLGAILGHNYTCWLKFKGGKGIATSAGVLAALMPWAFAISLGTWGLVFLCSRYVSLASIAAALVLPLGAWLAEPNKVLTAVAAAMGILAIYKHRANIERLLKGTEPKAGSKKAAASSAPVS